MLIAPISPTRARYIKLGTKGEWESLCRRDGTLRLAYFDVPHTLGLKGDANAIRDIYIKQGLQPGVAKSHATQVLAFYDADPNTLWITFADGRLWWCFAEPEVEPLADGPGSRLRRAKGGWRSTTLAGEPLRIAELSGAITQVAGFRGTICSLKPETMVDLVHRINGEGSSAIAVARAARQESLTAIEMLIKRLHPNDFEVLVDLIFAREWQRITPLGKTQKTVDLELVQHTTGQRAFVQVKSTTTQAEFDEYLSRLKERDDDFMFYAYHTSQRPLRCNDERVHLMDAAQLAELTLKAGLFDTLISKAS